MNETAQDAWFYSHEGERIGPVTFADLKIKAIEGGINPRLDMVWTHGMPEWKPAGEIDGLFERRAMTEVEEAAAAGDPYGPPDEDSPEDLMGEEGKWPGARRRSYLFIIFISPFLLNIGILMAAPLMESQFGAEISDWILLGCIALQLFFMIYVGIQRFPNLGMSRWWYLGNFIPFLNIWVNLRCFAYPSGYAYHKKLDGWGILLAIIYWLSVLFVLTMVATFIAMISGALGTPEQQKQLIDHSRPIVDAIRDLIDAVLEKVSPKP